MSENLDLVHRIAVDICREPDDGRVLVLSHVTGRGKTSGSHREHMAAGPAGVFHIRDGTVRRMVRYLDRAPALADLGLER